jgi:hypothetical protein
VIAAAVRQSGTSTRKEISQLPVIQAEKPENREKNIIGVHRILARPETDPVGCSDDIFTLDFAALADTNSLLISASACRAMRSAIPMEPPSRGPR